jgi:hypothetical protein
MKNSILLAGMFAALFGITTAGVVAEQYGGAEKQKPAAQAEKQKPGKPHTMTGCLEKGAEENTFRLTNVEGTGPKTVELHAEASKKLAAHLGHKIAITGPEIDPKTLEKGTAGKPEAGAPAAKSTSTEHHMRVNSVKMISSTCPS